MKAKNRTALVRQTTSSPIHALMRAALAIPGLALSREAAAQAPAEFTTLRAQYSDYRDYQSNDDRMKVKAPQLWVLTPLSESLELESSFVVDTISGASPLYLDTLSGASGSGIADTRTAGDLKLTHYFDHVSVALGGVYSTEDDYESAGALIEGKTWSDDKNTVLTIGLSGNSDKISSTMDSSLHQSRDTGNILIGVTQIIDLISTVQVNLTYSNGNGYFSDPYKTLDNRPRSRDEFAALIRYIRYLPSLQSSLHTDYRYFIDSWGLDSHTLESSIYYPLTARWTVRPNLRYYTQSTADFFSPHFPPRTVGGFFSADQRLSAFGGLTTGLQVIHDLGDGFSIDLSWEYLQQRPEFRIGGGSEGIQNFHAHFITTGVTKKFR